MTTDYFLPKGTKIKRYGIPHGIGRVTIPIEPQWHECLTTKDAYYNKADIAGKDPLDTSAPYTIHIPDKRYSLIEVEPEDLKRVCTQCDGHGEHSAALISGPYYCRDCSGIGYR